MKVIKILNNQNKLISEVTTEACSTEELSGFSLRMVLQGREGYTLNNRQVNIFPGYFLVLNHGTRFGREIYSDTPSTTFSVQYSRSFISDYRRSFVYDHTLLLDAADDDDVDLAKFTEGLYPLKNDLKFNMFHLKNHFDQPGEPELLLQEYLYQSLLLFHRLHDKNLLAAGQRLCFVKASTRMEIFKRLARVKDFIISQNGQHLTIEQLSQVACLSPCHLFKLFKDLYGCTPFQFLASVRLERARTLLAETRYPVNEIMGMVGLENASSFIRSFKKNTGITPQGYRFSCRA